MLVFVSFSFMLSVFYTHKIYGYVLPYIVLYRKPNMLFSHGDGKCFEGKSLVMSLMHIFPRAQPKATRMGSAGTLEFSATFNHIELKFRPRKLL